MITKILTINGTEYAYDESKNYTNRRKVATYYMPYVKGKEKPKEGVNNADRLMYTNWQRLTDAEKAEAVSQIWIFDVDRQEWDPQDLQ